MNILIEPIAGRGFRATANDTFPAIAEAETEEEALNAVQKLLDARASGAVKVVIGKMPSRASHPLLRFSGDLRDDPLYDRWQAAIQERRRAEDADPDVF